MSNNLKQLINNHEKQIKRIYKAFGQDGGTIHQLKEVILNGKNGYIVEGIIYEYLLNLMNTENNIYLDLQINKLENNLTIK